MDTETLRNAANYLLICGLVLSALGTFGVNHFRAKLEKERQITSGQKERDAEAQAAALRANVDELIAGKNELVQQNQQLRQDIETYRDAVSQRETEIAALQKAVIAAKRGIIERFDFNGARRAQSGGQVTVVVGPETEVFQRLQILSNQGDFAAVITLCTEQIQKTPDWLTPYLARAEAYIRLGKHSKAIADLEHVVNAAAGDPDYRVAEELLRIARQGKSGS